MNFSPISAPDILKWDPGQKTWVWDTFIPPSSLCLVVGFMKTGKSTFVYPLAIAIAQGKPFLGSPTRKGGVLILSVEECWRDVRDRLERFGMKPEDPIYVHCGPLSCDHQTLSLISNFVSQNGVSMVIVDTLSMFWDVSDENNNAEVIKKVRPLLELARATGCALCLVHHASKGGGDHGRGIRGASSLLGVVDQAILLERRVGGNQNQRVLKTLGRYSESPSELIIELQGNDWVSLGSGTDAWRTEQLGRIFEALSSEPQTVESLASATGLSNKQTRKFLDSLLSQGQVDRNGKGKKGDPYVYSK